MEHLPNLLDMFRVAKFEDGVLVLLIWGGNQLRKWLKANSWTLNVTNRAGRRHIDFHAENGPAPLPVSNAKSLPAETKPASRKRKRNRALPSDTNADAS